MDVFSNSLFKGVTQLLISLLLFQADSDDGAVQT